MTLRRARIWIAFGTLYHVLIPLLDHRTRPAPRNIKGGCTRQQMKALVGLRKNEFKSMLEMRADAIDEDQLDADKLVEEIFTPKLCLGHRSRESSFKVNIERPRRTLFFTKVCMHPHPLARHPFGLPCHRYLGSLPSYQ